MHASRNRVLVLDELSREIVRSRALCEEAAKDLAATQAKVAELQAEQVALIAELNASISALEAAS